MMAVVANKDIRPPLGVLKIQDGGGGLRGGFWDFFSESFQQSGTLFFLALSLSIQSLEHIPYFHRSPFSAEGSSFYLGWPGRKPRNRWKFRRDYLDLLSLEISVGAKGSAVFVNQFGLSSQTLKDSRRALLLIRGNFAKQLNFDAVTASTSRNGCHFRATLPGETEPVSTIK